MFKKILLPVDGSKPALKATEFACEISKRFQSEVTALYVYSVPIGMGAFPGIPVALPPDPEMIEGLKKIGEDTLEETKKILEKENITTYTCLEYGHTAEIICRIAEEENYDLIVIGSQGLSGIPSFFLGSTSEKVSNHAPCPVLIVR